MTNADIIFQQSVRKIDGFFQPYKDGYHAYQSFKTGEVSAAECHQIGLETARKLWGDNYQVLVATHFNTGTYHNHFVVNSVGMWDGHKLEAKYGVYYGNVLPQAGLLFQSSPRDWLSMNTPIFTKP